MTELYIQLYFCQLQSTQLPLIVAIITENVNLYALPSCNRLNLKY
jgi:hypothetical protein